MRRLNRLSYRHVYLFGFAVCAFLFIASLFFEFALGLTPCPLCIMQRLSVLFLGLFMLAAIFHNPAHIGQKIYGTLIFLLAVLGAAVALRQVWLQIMPQALPPSCGASLMYMLKTLPLNQTLHLLLQGSGDCAEVTWRFLGLSMAGWMALFFGFFAILAVWQTLRKPLHNIR